MLIIPPPRRRQRRPARLASRDVQGLVILSVRPGSNPTLLRVFFNAPIVWNGADVPAAFLAYTDDGFMDGPINVSATGSTWIELEFNAGVALGATWTLVAPMTGVAPVISYPQDGIVIA